MGYVRMTKEEMDEKLKSEKGWECNRTGNEYVYDFHLKHFPIIIKVASSIRIDTDRARNKGSDAIRVYAVMKDGLDKKAKIIRGLVKARRVNRMTNWRTHLEAAVYSVIKRSKVVYHKHKW